MHVALSRQSRAIAVAQLKSYILLCLSTEKQLAQLTGKFLLFSSSGGHKTKETYPTRPGSPTPCKQGLRQTYALQNKQM